MLDLDTLERIAKDDRVAFNADTIRRLIGRIRSLDSRAGDASTGQAEEGRDAFETAYVAHRNAQKAQMNFSQRDLTVEEVIALRKGDTYEEGIGPYSGYLVGCWDGWTMAHSTLPRQQATHVAGLQQPAPEAPAPVMAACTVGNPTLLAAMETKSVPQGSRNPCVVLMPVPRLEAAKSATDDGHSFRYQSISTEGQP